MIPVLVSWSGGKDAAWALHVLRGDSRFRPLGLLTTFTAGEERVAMQGIRADVLRAQAAAVGLPLIEAWQPAGCSNLVHERIQADALQRAVRQLGDVRHVAFGDLALDDLREWREALYARLGWTALFPLFGADTAALAGQMIAAGLRARLCSVDTSQLDGTFAGRAFDRDLLQALPASVDACGERGEFHTLVEAGPMLAGGVSVRAGASWLQDGRFQRVDFMLADAAGTAR